MEERDRDYRYDRRDDSRGDYRNYRDYRDYRDDYDRRTRGRMYRDRYGRNYRSQEEYHECLEDILEDSMDLARAYEDVSEMAMNSNEKSKLMKIAEREKEHYRTVKEMLEGRM